MHNNKFFFSSDHNTITLNRAEILKRKLYNQDSSDVLAMLEYSEGSTPKTFSYLKSGKDLIGYAYIEHLGSNPGERGVMGVFLAPIFRGKGLSTKLIQVLKRKLHHLGYGRMKLSVDPRAMELFKSVFGSRIKQLA